MKFGRHTLTVGAFEILTIDTTVGGIGITASKYHLTSGDFNGCLAHGAKLGPLEGGEIRYTVDGTTVTATAGHLMQVGETREIEDHAAIKNFKAIRTGSESGTLPVSLYF